VFGLYGMFSYCLSLVLQSGIPDMFRNPCGDVTANLSENACECANTLFYKTSINSQEL
jgi:hypothetical protein